MGVSSARQVCDEKPYQVDPRGGLHYSRWDVTQEEIEAAIDAEEELEKYRKLSVWN